MKSFFFSQKNRLYLFTERLSELVGSGLSVQKSLSILKAFSFRDKKFREGTGELYFSLSRGSRFSAALKMASFIDFPDWYTAFISLAEECGCLSGILRHLMDILDYRQKCVKKVFSIMLYPLFLLFLTALTGIFFAFYFMPAYFFLFGEKGNDIQLLAKKAVMEANGFLLAFLFLFFVFLRKNFVEKTSCQLFKSLSFLEENKIPTLRALTLAISFSSSDRKVSRALIAVKNQLLEGRSLSLSFGEAFEKSGLREEGIILSENLALCQETGKNNAFEKSYCFLSERQKLREKNFLSLLQPVIFLVTAIYAGFILKTAFLPFISDFGCLI